MLSCLYILQKKVCIALLCLQGMLLSHATNLFAQSAEDAENLMLPKHGTCIGGHIASSGLGIDIQHYRYQNEDWEWGIGLRIASLTHPKESRVDGIYKDQGGSSFIYDKMNYCYTASLLYGWQKNLTKLDLYNRLHIKAGLFFGPSIAILKPYFLDIAVPVSPPTTPPRAEIQSMAYDPQKITYNDIYGQSDFSNGTDLLSGVPGMTLRPQIAFHLGANRSAIRAILVGADASFYFRTVRIMGNTPNQQIYIQGIVGFLIGGCSK